MLSAVMARAALLALLWWVITRGEASAWLIGLPAVLAAAVASVRLGRSGLLRVSPIGLAGLVALFVRESVRGGLDVARRTLAPRLRIRPGFRTFQVRLTDPLARVLLVNCISLMPGTLAARLEGNRLEVHLLDAGQDPDPDLHDLERAIARVFGLSLETTGG
jgi:multicomponent Na+:H+ antiporter subunit E